MRAVLSEITKNGVSGSSGIAVKGGEVLAIIYDRMQNMSGDPTASTIYGTLLKAAGKPYVEMIRDWVSTGKLVDPYEELLVKESKFINRGILEMDYTDEYWERRYTVSQQTNHWTWSYCTLLSNHSSYVTAQLPRRLRDPKQASRRFAPMVDYRVALVYLHSLKDGSTRYSLLENT